MSGMEVPIAMGALSGLGGYLGGGRPTQAQIAQFGRGPGYEGLTPQTLIRGALGDLGRMGGAATQYASSPVSLASSYVQPLPIFKGAGPVDVFASAIDPAWVRPELLTRGGVNWGDPEESAGTPFSRSSGAGSPNEPHPVTGDVAPSEVAEGGRSLMGTAVQQPAPAPTLGGAHSDLAEMKRAIDLMRPHSDPAGSLQDYLFTGASGGRGIARRRDPRLSKLQESVYQEAGYPSTGSGEPSVT